MSFPTVVCGKRRRNFTIASGQIFFADTNAGRRFYGRVLDSEVDLPSGIFREAEGIL